MLFGAEVFAELRGADGRRRGADRWCGPDPERVREVPFDLPMPDDVDTPEDYARLM